MSTDRSLEYLITGVALRCLHCDPGRSSGIRLGENSHDFPSASRSPR